MLVYQYVSTSISLLPFIHSLIIPVQPPLAVAGRRGIKNPSPLSTLWVLLVWEEPSVSIFFYLPGLTFPLKPETRWSLLFSPPQSRVTHTGGAYLWCPSCG